MTVTRIQPSPTYVQDELRRIQDALANAIDQDTRRERTIFAGVYGNANQTDTGYHAFATTWLGNNYFAGWIADRPGSVIALSVYDTATLNNQQYGVSINSLAPATMITRGQTQSVFAAYPIGQLTFKQGDLLQVFARNSTTASTTFSATGHITVSVGA